MIQELTPQILSAVVLLVMLVAPTLTLPVSWLLLRRYRRAVSRAMAARGGGEGGSTAGAPRLTAPPAESMVIGTDIRSSVVAADDLYRRLVHDPWCNACIHAVAGIGFAAVMTLAYFIVFSLPLQPVPVLLSVCMFSWPIVLTMNLVVASSWRPRVNTALMYFAALAVVATLAVVTPNLSEVNMGAIDLPSRSTITPIGAARIWLGLNLLPTILLLLFLNRRVRAVGPMVLSFMIVATGGSFMAWLGMFFRRGPELLVRLGTALRVNRWGMFGLVLGGVLLALAAFGVLSWFMLGWIRRAYQRKLISDQSLTLDAIWLTFATYYSVFLFLGGLRWVLFGVIAFLVYRLGVTVGHAFLARGDSRPRSELLFLRVFSLGRRSEQMFDAVAKHWRYLDTVQLIVGPDLATTTVAPHQFLEYVAGRLPRLFVDNEQALQQRVKELDTRPDADARFRVSTFFCHADTWTGVLSRLMKDTHVVLMDLRAFAPDNAGCVLELKELINVVPLRQCVLVVDKTTDQPFLERSAEEAWRAMDPASPNRTSSPAELQPFPIGSLGKAELRRLLRRLCDAAAPTPTLAGVNPVQANPA